MSLLHHTFAEMKRSIRWDDTPYCDYRLKTPNEVEVFKRAKCSDAVLYLQEKLKDVYSCLPVRALIKSDRLIGITHRDRWVHVFMIVYDDDDLYLVEWRWCESLSGVFGPFDSLPSLISFVEHIYPALLKEKYKQQFSLAFAPFDKPIYGATLEELSYGDGVFERMKELEPERLSLFAKASESKNETNNSITRYRESGIASSSFDEYSCRARSHYDFNFQHLERAETWSQRRMQNKK